MLRRIKKSAIMSLLVTAPGYAASTGVGFMETHLNSSQYRELGFKDIDGHIGGTSNQFSEQVGNVPGNRYNFDLDFDYSKNVDTRDTNKIERRFHISALNNDRGLTMYSLQEAYIGGNITSRDHIRFGRQVLSWSKADAAWGFGKINNRVNFDYFTPGQEGLIGLLYERRPESGFRLRAFASPLYVPELNPSLDIDKKNKSISARHPWADTPASSAEVEGVMMQVQYEVDYPEISEVIYRYTAGLNLGWESEHWVFDNFFIRKPENTLTADVQINVDFSQSIVGAQIDPRFYYHDVYGSTLKYRNRDLEMYISGIAVRPNEFPDVDERVRYTEIKNQKRREDYVGGGISRSNDLYTIAFNYIARLSPFDRKKDDLALDPRWNQAVNFTAIRNFGRRYSVAADLKFDMLTTDRLFMLRGSYNVSKQLVMNIGVNMIGTPGDGKSFWSPYTNNDAIYGGLRYVF